MRRKTQMANVIAVAIVVIGAGLLVLGLVLLVTL